MAELKDHSLFMRLAFLFMVTAYSLDLYAIDTPGWSTRFNCGGGGGPGCNDGWYTGVEVCEVPGYLCGLTAVMLIICLTFLDEVKSNKIALICFIVFSMVAGFLYIVGAAVYGAEASGSDYSIMLVVIGGMLAIAAGALGIVEVVKGGK